MSLEVDLEELEADAREGAHAAAQEIETASRRHADTKRQLQERYAEWDTLLGSGRNEEGDEMTGRSGRSGRGAARRDGEEAHDAPPPAARRGSRTRARPRAGVASARTSAPCS